MLWIVILAIGCSSKITKDDLNSLNGYWEISVVKFPDGQEKTYSVNTTIDFIELQDGNGFRKKVYPDLTGSYRTSDDAEQFVIQELDGRFIMRYHNGPNQWEERLLKVSEDNFSVRNAEDITYVYRRYQPLNTER